MVLSYQDGVEPERDGIAHKMVGGATDTGICSFKADNKKWKREIEQMKREVLAENMEKGKDNRGKKDDNRDMENTERGKV